MKAFVTSVGESTTALCIWALERQGFDVELIKDRSTSLASKLKAIYDRATGDFIRVDADVIANNNLTEDYLKKLEDDIWWWQFQTYDWFKQDSTNGGVQYIRSEAIPLLRANVARFKQAERPESQLFRLDEFHNPRKCATRNILMGLNGYKHNDIERVIQTKTRRGQMDSYDFELAEKLEQLCV